MNIAITGGTGLVGRTLTKLLQQHGHTVYILTRGEQKVENGIHYIHYLSSDATPEQYLQHIDAFVNLAGVSLNSGRWTEETKEAIYNSRIDATREVLRIIKAMEQKPRVLVNASAVGIYPASKTNEYTEATTHLANDFLGTTVRHWEAEANRANELGVRVAIGRFGVILHADAESLQLMAMPYKFGVGGRIGSGKQWLSWVHVEDVARALYFAIEHEELTGPFNVVSPKPMTMHAFGATLGEVLLSPHWLPVPALALQLALGEKSTLVVDGQHVKPKVLLDHGFTFQYPDAKQALQHIFHT
ncbi:MAG: TIGR01777 family oxidoreductase [Caryophanon sp.]|nr:TIGR01777 family oxidoreductase [Caryophanon sp.]